MITPLDVARVIDHTFLKQSGLSLEQQKEQVEILFKQAHQGEAYSVCVRESMVAWANSFKTKLFSQVKICSVIGFPMGDDYSSAQKIELLQQAQVDGAEEFDMVICYEALKKGNYQKVYADILAVSSASQDLVLKVIFENVYLTTEQKIKAYQIADQAFQDSGYTQRRFFKTSTGFAKHTSLPIGATLEDIHLMHSVSQKKYGIKAAGGVQTFADAVQFWQAVGSPELPQGGIDPMKFRIGSSTLLSKLT